MQIAVHPDCADGGRRREGVVLGRGGGESNKGQEKRFEKREEAV